MKNFVLRFAALILFTLMIFFGSGIGAAAMKIDGILTDSEWKNAPVFVLENQRNFDNKINSAVVKTVTDKKNGCIYLSVMIEFKKTGNLKDGAVKVSVNGTTPALITLGSGVAESGDYPMEASSDIDELSGCTVTEIAVHFKDGPSDSEKIKLTFIDLNGDESGVYTVDVREKEPETTTKTTKTTTTRTTKTTTIKTTTTKSTKTTTTKTTTTKTTKTTTTKTTKSTAGRTTSEKASEAEKITDEKASESRIAQKPEKTEDDFTFKKAVKTTASETAEKIKTTKLPKKNKTSSAPKKSDDAIYEEQPVNKVFNDTAEAESASENSENQDVFYPEEGKSRKYTFVVIGAACAVVLTAAAVAAAAKSNKKDDE